MSIKEIRQKIKGLHRISNNKDLLVILLIILVGFASFGLGRLSNTQITKKPIRLEDASVIVNSAPIPVSNKLYVASKNGTKYHLPWCSGARRISLKNMIWFETKEEAERAGYQPASNCKGI